MDFLNKWKEKATDYVDVRLQLAKLTFVEKSSVVLGFVMLSFILLFLALAVLIFLGIGLMEGMSSLLDGNRVAAAFITFGFYALLAGAFVALRMQIVNAFAGMFVRIMTDQKHDTEEQHGKKVDVA